MASFRCVLVGLVTLAAAAVGAAGEPVRVCARNPRYLEWRGRPVAVVTSAEHYGAMLNRDFDFHRYLATLEKEGMPYTRIFSGSYVEPPGAFGIERNTLAPAPGRFLAPWPRSATPGYAGGGNRFDLEKWDEEYLRRLKEFLTEAGQHGILVELTLFCSTYSDRQWGLSPFNPVNNVSGTRLTDWKALNTFDNQGVLDFQLRLARYLARELNEFDNLVYEIQNEPWSDHHDLGETLNPYLRNQNLFPNRVEITQPVAVAWQTRIAAALLEEEAKRPKKHLLFQNVANFRLAVRPSDLAPGVSALNFHYPFPEAATWNEGLRMPITCDETGFQGTDDAPYRQQAWAFMLAGGGLFNHLDYSFAVGKEDGSDRQPHSPGGGSLALRRQLRVLGDFLNGFDLVRLRPDRTSVVRSPGVVGYCLADRGQQYALYLRGRGPTEVTLQLPAGNYRGEWIDVLTGKSLKSEGFEVPSEQEHRLASPPFSEEIALRVLRQ